MTSTTAQVVHMSTMHRETEDDHGDESDDSSNPNDKIYGYGTASVAIISLMSLLGILLFPMLKSRSYGTAMHFLIALAIGTMTSDALVHMIPSVLDVHSHDHDENQHEQAHSDNEEESDEDTVFVWRMSVVFLGIYVFYFFENGMKAWKRSRTVAENSPLSSLSQQAEFTEEVSENSSRKSSVEMRDLESSVVETERNRSGTNDVTDSHTMLNRNDTVCCNFTATLVTVFVGDILHNFADGIAIGVSFADSWTAGVGTSIAIMCHEIPHEFGDFAIYMNNGATKWKAILLNLAAACCAFFGLYAGIGLGQEETIRSWLLALVAGMFLYISLVQVMSSMVQEELSQPLTQFALQNIGMILGWALMLLLALYEEDIEDSFSGKD